MPKTDNAPAPRRCWLFSDNCPAGQMFTGEDAIAEAIKSGWKDSPAKVKAAPTSEEQAAEERARLKAELRAEVIAELEAEAANVFADNKKQSGKGKGGNDGKADS